MQTVKSICEGAEGETQISEISKSSDDIRVLCYISEQLNYFNSHLTKFSFGFLIISSVRNLQQPIPRAYEMESVQKNSDVAIIGFWGLLL